MAWTASGVFTAFMKDALQNISALDLNAETHKVALFGTAVTPDFEATSANSAYNAGTWTTGNEITGTNWSAGGQTLTSTTVTSTGGTVTFDAADISVASTTLTAVLGCLIYADALTTPVAKQGIMAIYFGGTSYSTVNGTFTITWSASGIATVDVTP